MKKMKENREKQKLAKTEMWIEAESKYKRTQFVNREEDNEQNTERSIHYATQSYCQFACQPTYAECSS